MIACRQIYIAFICICCAGIPLLPLLDGQQGTMHSYKSHRHSYFVPSKLDTELLEKAKSLLVDLELLDRECCDRCCSALSFLLCMPFDGSTFLHHLSQCVVYAYAFTRAICIA